MYLLRTKTVRTRPLSLRALIVGSAIVVALHFGGCPRIEVQSTRSET
jgi:hypothetical protein